VSEVAASAADVPPAVPGTLREFWQAYTQSRGAIIGIALIVVLVVLAIGANVIAPHSPYEQFRDFTLAPPAWHDGGSARFLLGTDPVGRDILSRLIHGTRLSLLIGVISVAISLSLGVVLGLAAGYLWRARRDDDHAPDGRDAVAAEPAAGDRSRRHPRPGLIIAMYAIAIVLAVALTCG
jgi:hypothetical protein